MKGSQQSIFDDGIEGSCWIAWYAFCEGSTPWRTDPIAMALVFGLRTLEQIEAAFPGRLYELMMSRFVTDGQ